MLNTAFLNINQVLAETNQGYMNSNAALEVVRLCAEEATIDDTNRQLQPFMLEHQRFSTEQGGTNKKKEHHRSTDSLDEWQETYLDSNSNSQQPYSPGDEGQRSCGNKTSQFCGRCGPPRWQL